MRAHTHLLSQLAFWIKYSLSQAKQSKAIGSSALEEMALSTQNPVLGITGRVTESFCDVCDGHHICEWNLDSWMVGLALSQREAGRSQASEAQPQTSTPTPLPPPPENSSLTVRALHQRRGRASHAPPRLPVGHEAGVVAHVGRLHLGDVQVARLLGNESPLVLLDMQRVVVEGPRVRQIWKTGKRPRVCTSYLINGRHCRRRKLSLWKFCALFIRGENKMPPLCVRCVSAVLVYR